MGANTKTAIVLGATGLTGGMLLGMLLRDLRYSKIKLFSRTSVGFSHAKMEEHLGDLMHLERYKANFYGDEVFCCIGTTKTKTPDKQMYRSIDYGIPLKAARMAKEKNIGTFIVISALGANGKSRIFYNRIKGEMEADLIISEIDRIFILRPSLLTGKRIEKRPGEWFAGQIMKGMNPLLVGPLDKFSSIYAGDVARCMLWLANNPFEHRIIPSDEIRRIALKYSR